MNDTALLRRLKAQDPAALADDPTAVHSDAATDTEIARIAALPADRARRRTAIRRVGWRAAAGVLAFGAVGVGVAYAAGIPQDVARVFAEQRAPAGAPGPWGAHNVTLATTLPLDGSNRIQVWTADNQMSGTCDYYRLIGAGNSVRDLGDGCEGSFTSTSAPAGAAPQLAHQSVEIHQLTYQTDEGTAKVLIGKVFDPAVSGGTVQVPAEKAVPLTFSADKHWVIARLPVGVDPGVDGSTMRLDTSGGSVASTIDLVDYSASPKSSSTRTGRSPGRPGDADDGWADHGIGQRGGSGGGHGRRAPRRGAIGMLSRSRVAGVAGRPGVAGRQVSQEVRPAGS